ncbi:MAG: PepSY-associated TM helix domain-containing protein [Pseudomonadota bacterium]
MDTISAGAAALPKEQPRPAVKKKKSKRKKLYDLHAWVGFQLAIIMSLVLFTGTFATISQELDWLANPAMRVSPDGEMVSMQAMVDAVEAQDPAATVMGIGPGEGDHFAYEVRVFTADGVVKTRLVDQWTGEVTGERGFFDIKYFFRQLHRYLFLPAWLGLTVVSSMAIVLSISLYTGLKTSRNWRTLMTRIRFSKGARTAIGDAHKAAGLWSIWFFVLMISTGLWYYAEFLGTDFEPRQPAVAEERITTMGDVLVNPKVPQIIDAAQAAYPDLQISDITFGGVLGPNAIMVDGTVGNPIVRKRANRVFLDPVSLEVIHVARDRDLDWVQWLNQIADPLHFGNFGGLPVKLIWFTFGLFMTGLSISGVWLTWRRLRLNGASRVQLSMLPLVLLAGVAGSLSYMATALPFQSGIDLYGPAWFVVGLWLGGLALIGLWLFIKRLRRADRKRIGFLNGFYAILILAAGGSAVHATVLQRPFASPVEQDLGSRSVGPVEASLYLETDKSDQLHGNARLVLAGIGGRPNIKEISLRLKDGEAYLEDEEEAITRRIRLALVEQPIYVKLPADKLSGASHIEATIEMHSGPKHALVWAIR